MDSLHDFQQHKARLLTTFTTDRLELLKYKAIDGDMSLIRTLEGTWVMECFDDPLFLSPFRGLNLCRKDLGDEYWILWVALQSDAWLCALLSVASTTFEGSATLFSEHCENSLFKAIVKCFESDKVELPSLGTDIQKSLHDI